MPDLLPYPPQPVSLTGDVVELRPLQPAHADGLREAVADGRLWDLWFTVVPRPEGISEWLDKALSQQAAGAALPFTVFERATGRIVGATRYMNIEPACRRLEIGATWYAARVQRTPLNSEAKLLLLRHAFEAIGCIAVEFRTHFFNHRSREAIAKLGARQDGILRQHSLTADGSYRDTVVFSILNHEWPTVQTHLQHRLQRLRRLARPSLQET